MVLRPSAITRTETLSFRAGRQAGHFRRLIALLVISLAIPAAAISQASPGDLDLAKYKGKVVYVDFWASWCGPCQESFPWMSALEKRMPADDFVLIAVNVDHEREKADAFLRRVGGGVPVVYDSDGAIARKFGVKGMPSSFVIGRDGRTLFSHEGFFIEKEPTYEAHISEARRAK